MAMLIKEVYICRIVKRDTAFGIPSDFFAESEEQIIKILKKNGFKPSKDSDAWINKKEGYIAEIYSLDHIENANRLL